MKMDLRYLGRSGVRAETWGTLLQFKPNLARPRVLFDAEVRHPVRFREAISALHDVVVGDLRFKKRDKTAYKAWQKQQAGQEAQLRQQLFEQAKADNLARQVREPVPPNLEADFRRMHQLYWTERRRWAVELQRHDPELFRHLVPCDPVITVAPDVVFFECFSKDESSYGCLLVDRGAFKDERAASLGTTNVDYSLPLFEHFQTLRSYRPTRLVVDPSGFEVKVAGQADYHEEKIDLPPSWLRGFGQLQAAMGLPARTVELPVETVYSLLSHLKRNREKTGPRSLRFQLAPGKPPTVVLDPWNIPVTSRGRAYQGERAEEVKVWGRRRLMVLARVLPLCERVEVRLLGTGLPSIWIAHMGEMRLVVALSGWTANDWTAGSNLDLMTGKYRAEIAVTAQVERYLADAHSSSLSGLETTLRQPRDTLLGSLNLLARQGQVIYDFAADRYRYRQVMPVALSESVLGPESPEQENGRRLYVDNMVKISRDEALAGGRRLLVATAGGMQFEGILDGDGMISKAKCQCSHFHRFGLRAGPCRHLLALRFVAAERGN